MTQIATYLNTLKLITECVNVLFNSFTADVSNLPFIYTFSFIFVVFDFL